MKYLFWSHNRFTVQSEYSKLLCAAVVCLQQKHVRMMAATQMANVSVSWPCLCVYVGKCIKCICVSRILVRIRVLSELTKACDSKRWLWYHWKYWNRITKLKNGLKSFGLIFVKIFKSHFYTYFRGICTSKNMIPDIAIPFTIENLYICKMVHTENGNEFNNLNTGYIFYKAIYKSGNCWKFQMNKNKTLTKSELHNCTDTVCTYKQQ